MILNNNTSPLAFYESLDKQLHRQWHAYSRVYSLLCPYRKLLPFQIIVDEGTTAVTQATLINVTTGSSNSIMSYLTSNGLTHVNKSGYDIIYFPADSTLPFDTPEGLYYIVLSSGTRTFYSEVFNIVRTFNENRIVKLYYWDNSDLEFVLSKGNIAYDNRFKHIVYLQAEISKPQYVIEEEVEKRDGFEFIEKQVRKKMYRFTFLAPEYLCDAMSLVHMHDNIVILHKGITYDVHDILFTPSWQDDGFLASVEVEFSSATVIKKIGKQYPRAISGDFNNDYNDDYFKTI